MTITITKENATSLLIAGTITEEEFNAFFEATLATATAEAAAATAGKVHYGVTAGGAINLRGVPGSPGSFGLTLYSATIQWLAENIDDVVLHTTTHATEDFQRGSDGRVVRVTSNKEDSQQQKARCTAEIARWIIIAEDQLAAGFDLDEEWAIDQQGSDPELGGIYPPAKLAKLVGKGEYSKDVTSAIKAERKRS